MEFSNQSEKEIDAWDSVVDFEGRMFENGVSEGRADAKATREMFSHGDQAGFLKGILFFCTVYSKSNGHDNGLLCD